MNLALVWILILSISAFEVRINFEKATSETRRKNHFSSSTFESNKLKATEDDSKKYLDDYILTIPLTLGQTQLKQTIDTTSYISWVYTKQTETNLCTNCPNDAEIFKCEGSCQYSKTADDQKKIPLTTENTYGGRVVVTGSYATQDSLELMGLKANQVGLGLIDNLNAKEDPKYDFKAKNGVIGFAYGSDYIEYKNKKNAMVGEVKNEPPLEQTHSLLQQFHSQLNNVQASTFAIKLEDNLSLLIIGEQSNYFAESKFTQFTNVGKKAWALKVKKIAYGLEGNFASTGTAIFDSTTRFIWADNSVIQSFLKEIKNFQIECTQEDGLYKCPCNDEQFEKYKDIYFSFNLQDKIAYPLSKQDYIHREQNQCYLLMKTISDKNTLATQQEKPNVIIPYTFFKKNFVLFNQDTNQISISHSYQVNPDEIHIPQNTILYTAIVGVLLLLLSLFLLVNCMHKAPYDQDYLHQVDSGKGGQSRPVVNYQQPQQQQQQQQQQQKVKEEVTIKQNEVEDIESWEQFVEEGEAEQLQQEKDKQEKQQVEDQKRQQEQQILQQSYSSTIKKEILDLYKPVGELRSPICCILGHVDTGKTTLLDKIRNTNVQEGEAGGITQQIGATFFPAKKLKEELIKTQQFYPVDCNIPGLLIIDTPGHESFSNLRTRGSSLCDLAILVIDLMHGLENQTLESLELLKLRKTPFIIALNKIDRCVEWKNKKNASSYYQLQNQTKNCKMDYDTKRQQVITQLAEKGFNVAFFWENEDPKTYISVVPTSGFTGEGIPDLLSVIVKYTSVYMKNKIKVKEQFNCTVLEKKVTEGHGTTIDCLLIDGQIKKDDKIILAGFQGPIVTKVRALLTPHPMKEMRVKGEYIHHDIIYASMGLKISAVGLEEAMAGSQMYLANSQEDIDRATEIINNEMEEVKKYIKLQNQGVGVAASTLGSLEALLQYLNSQDIPVSYVSVGPVSKDDVMKALKNVLLEDVNRRKKEYACMLVFDVKILPDAQKFAEENQIKIFEANIIYHLFTKFTEFIKQVKEERKKKEAADVVFPSLLKIVRIINTKEPLILGVEVEQGILKTGTPLCIYDQNSNKNKIGIVETIELNHKSLKEARATTGAVALRIGTNQAIQAGKQITLETKLASLITRRAIDILKEHYREDLTLDDWQLVKDLKLFLNIV